MIKEVYEVPKAEVTVFELEEAIAASGLGAGLFEEIFGEADL